MSQPWLRAAAPLLLALSSAALAQADAPVTPAEMMRHIDRLASDEFQGRAPGTEGERRTIAYIVDQFQSRGLEPAGEGGTWFQPVPLVERRPGRSEVRWTTNSRAIPFDAGDVLLMGRDASETITDAPVIFAGHGARIPERGIDQLAGADLNGAVALILLQGPDVPGFPSLTERTRALTAAGAVAVIAIAGADLPWRLVSASFGGGTTRLDSGPTPRIVGAMPIGAAQRLVAASGGDLGRLLNDQPGSSFRAVTLPMRASLQVTTAVQRYTSNNVVGRLRGSGETGESLLYLAHWDHLGICRPQGAADRICNGAIDNASGVAMMIEVAGRLGRRPRPPRDILFLATTAEETGLLGAEYFAAHPAVPVGSIVAALNLDTVALHPAGKPVAVLGRGLRALDAAIDATVAAMGRRLDQDDGAAAFAERHDGWALARAGIPAVMVGGSFSDMRVVEAFVSTTYHQPGDQPGGRIVLEGAAEDADLLVALGRRLADPAQYRRAQRPAE